MVRLPLLLTEHVCVVKGLPGKNIPGFHMMDCDLNLIINREFGEF